MELRFIPKKKEQHEKTIFDDKDDDNDNNADADNNNDYDTDDNKDRPLLI